MTDFEYSQPPKYEFETPEFVMVNAVWRHPGCRKEFCHVKMFHGPHLEPFLRTSRPDLNLCDAERRMVELSKARIEAPLPLSS